MWFSKQVVSVRKIWAIMQKYQSGKLPVRHILNNCNYILHKCKAHSHFNTSHSVVYYCLISAKKSNHIYLTCILHDTAFTVHSLGIAIFLAFSCRYVYFKQNHLAWINGHQWSPALSSYLSLEINWNQQSPCFDLDMHNICFGQGNGCQGDKWT